MDETAKKPHILSAVDVYYGFIPSEPKLRAVYPKERSEEIFACANERVRAEKYYVWKLLAVALKKSLGVSLKTLRFTKQENGKWTCDGCQFSLSHSHGVVAVAVSSRPVGVDVEKIEKPRVEGIYKRVFTSEEQAIFDGLEIERKTAYFIEKWTKKESLFKWGGKVFASEKAEGAAVESRVIERAGESYFLSVAVAQGERVGVFAEIKL